MHAHVHIPRGGIFPRLIEHHHLHACRFQRPAGALDVPRGHDPRVRDQQSLSGSQFPSQFTQLVNAIDAEDHARAWEEVKTDDGRHALALEAWPAVLEDLGGDHDITDVRTSRKFPVVSLAQSKRADCGDTHLLIESRQNA